MTTKAEEKPREAGGDFKSIDKYLTRGGGSVALAVLIWMNTTLSSMDAEITGLNNTMIEVTTDLKYQPRVTIEEVREIVEAAAVKIKDSYPWNRDKERWEKWKESTTADLLDVKARVRGLEKKQGVATTAKDSH